MPCCTTRGPRIRGITRPIIFPTGNCRSRSHSSTNWSRLASMSNPLAPVIAWYKDARDSLLDTRNIITSGIKGAVTRKHVFHGKSSADNTTALAQAKEELDRLVVLGLVAVFERTLRDHLIALPVIPPTSGHPLHDA